MLLKKYTKQILDHPPKMISVSMDGYTSELHDEIRGLKGSWQKAIDGMISLFEEKKKRGSIFGFILTIAMGILKLC